MELTTYDPQKHLTPADQQRLAELAKGENKTEADFIEATLKRRLWRDEHTIITPPRAQLGRGGSRRMAHA